MSRIALGFADDFAICSLLPEDTEALANSADPAEADAVFISCGSMGIRPVLTAVERALGKPSAHHDYGRDAERTARARHQGAARRNGKAVRFPALSEATPERRCAFVFSCIQFCRGP